MASKVIELNLDKKTYLVVPKSEYMRPEVDFYRKCLAIPADADITIGYLIRQHRTKLNISQKTLGSLTGPDQKHIDKIENGIIRTPRPDLIRKLVEVLGDDFRNALIYFGFLTETKK